MPSRDELLQLYDNSAQTHPIPHHTVDWPYEVSHERYVAYMHVPHDIGGTPAAPQPFEDKEEEEWELNTYITCEVLGWRGAWNSEERRRRADNDVGETLYYGFPYYGRWIWSAARTLVDKNFISLIELIDKIAEVKARKGGNGQSSWWKPAAPAKAAKPSVPKKKGEAKSAPVRFNVGDRVRVKDAPNLFYSRTQMYVRGVTGTIARCVYQTLGPEDEAFNRDDAPSQQFYIIRFRQKDLWPEYPFDNDTLQTELPDSWLEPAH